MKKERNLSKVSALKAISQTSGILARRLRGNGFRVEGEIVSVNPNYKICYEEEEIGEVKNGRVIIFDNLDLENLLDGFDFDTENP